MTWGIFFIFGFSIILSLLTVVLYSKFLVKNEDNEQNPESYTEMKLLIREGMVQSTLVSYDTESNSNLIEPSSKDLPDENSTEEISKEADLTLEIPKSPEEKTLVKDWDSKRTDFNNSSFFNKMGRMEVMLFAVCCITYFLLFSIITEFINIKSFSSKEGNFSVTFFGEPHLTKEDAKASFGNVTIYNYVSSENNISYKVTYYDYPKYSAEIEVKDAYWDGPSRVALSKLIGQITTKEFVNSNGIDFMQLTYEVQRTNGSTIKSRFAIVKNRFYQLTVSIPDEELNKKETTKKINDFFTSFKLEEEN